MRIETGIRVEYLSSAWMTVEVLGSIGLGLMAGSFALLAFGGDSLIELISGLAVLSHLRKDATGSEIGTRRTELLTTSLLFALIPVVGLGAVYSFVSGLRPEGSPLGIILATGAVVIMPYLWWQKRRIGRETRSMPMSIDAIESVTCFFMSVALLGGLLAEYFFGFWWADYLATIAIMGFVAREALESYSGLKGREQPERSKIASDLKDRQSNLTRFINKNPRLSLARTRPFRLTFDVAAEDQGKGRISTFRQPVSTT